MSRCHTRPHLITRGFHEVLHELIITLTSIHLWASPPTRRVTTTLKRRAWNSFCSRTTTWSMIIDGKEKDLEVTSLPAYHVEEADRTSAHSEFPIVSPLLFGQYSSSPDFLDRLPCFRRAQYFQSRFTHKTGSISSVPASWLSVSRCTARSGYDTWFGALLLITGIANLKTQCRSCARWVLRDRFDWS